MAKRSIEFTRESEEEEDEDDVIEEIFVEEDEDEDELEEEAEEKKKEEEEGVVEERKKRVRAGIDGERRGSAVAVNSISTTQRCQADNCEADLGVAKKYHQRHKVCENHSKAKVVLVGGIQQRYCQQCSRYIEKKKKKRTSVFLRFLGFLVCEFMSYKLGFYQVSCFIGECEKKEEMGCLEESQFSKLRKWGSIK